MNNQKISRYIQLVVVFISLLFFINPLLFINYDVYPISADVYFSLKTIMLIFLLYTILRLSSNIHNGK